ncbi:MAG: aminomethyl-transferring glycine dehydrogenase subunit GcvPA [Chloroflexi bacterium]|nr:aminomethyl-transferring glycine dehydrogenase subunit GcvPA [Chloroflexota bacterium]
MPSPYIPNTPVQRQEMLKAMGVSSVDEFFTDIPINYRHPELKLPLPLSELDLKREMQTLAGRNANLEEYISFLGGGAYNHYVPSVIHHITSRGELSTAYTPYQGEISQGILQSLYEYQTLICQLTGMEVSNAGMYDGPAAAAEAALMACRTTGREKVTIARTVSLTYQGVISTYLSRPGLMVEEIAPEAEGLDGNCACLIVQYPNFFGYIEDVAAQTRAAHEAGALLVLVADPIALGMFRSPGELGADVVVGEGQPLGNPLSFGGPYLGLLACRSQYLRQMPGRLISRTTDARGQVGYVMTLMTREQHIRRERATSNICTNETLLAVAAAVYLAALGREGLRQVAELCYHKAHYAAQQISRLPGYSVPFSDTFFKEFVVICPQLPEEINRRLLEKKIIGGLDVSHMVPNGMLLCVTEMNSREDIDRLVRELAPLGEEI